MLGLGLEHETVGAFFAPLVAPEVQGARESGRYGVPLTGRPYDCREKGDQTQQGQHPLHADRLNGAPSYSINLSDLEKTDN